MALTTLKLEGHLNLFETAEAARAALGA